MFKFFLRARVRVGMNSEEKHSRDVRGKTRVPIDNPKNIIQFGGDILLLPGGQWLNPE